MKLPCACSLSWVALVLCLGAARASTGPVSTRPSSESRVQALQRVFDVAPSGVDLLGPLSRVLAGFKAQLASDEVLEELVAALNAGPDPDQLSRLFLHRTPVPALFVADKQWQFGEWSDIVHLMAYLYRRSQRMAETSPLRAADWARAAVLLGAHQDFKATPIALRMCRDASFAKVAQLSEQQKAALDALLAANEEAARRFHEAGYLGMARALDALIVDKSPTLPDAKVDALLQFMARCWNARTGFPEDDYDLAACAAELIALVRARGTAEQLNQVRAMLTEWGQELPTDAPALKWLQEASEYAGPPPRSPRVVDLSQHR